MTAPGATILGCAGTALSPGEAAFFREADPWGFILFDRNLEAPDQIRRLTGAFRDAVGRDAPVLIDQEGGRVQRLRPPLARAWVPPLDQAERSGEGADRGFFQRYRLIAEELRSLGIDANCAPVADIADAATHPFLRNRCYGSNPDRVIRLAAAAASGLRAGGVMPVLKHMPGHGRARADSHLELPVVRADAATLRARDFAPFAVLARRPDDLPLGMTAHVVFTAFDAERPATTSPVLHRLMREEIGFDGLLMTDDLSMNALGGTMAERSRAALDAGCDVILHCNGEMAEMTAVADEAGRMSPLAVARAERALALRRGAQAFDMGQFEQDLDGFFGTA